MPFAEYVPAALVLPAVQHATSTWCSATSWPATGPATCASAGARVGDVICFEVAYDGLVDDVVDGGAEMIVVQTNNATFGRSDET